ncbi:MAG: hypothetical protein CMJ94_13895 [Planctomycetes bacterium]|nr:hypothetical protein [Planctomycetota bacterium]
MFLSALPAIAVATLAFTLVHVWVLMRVEPAYPRAFKLSRGVAAVVLTAIGFVGLGLALPDWKDAFLVHHEPGDLLRWGVIIAYGHLMSDFVWMAYGSLRHGISPRRDLIFHHGLGAAAYAYALQIEVGYGMVMVTLASEIMPCFTGLEAYGKYRASEAVQRLAARARLIVLSIWRIPLWVFALVMCIWNLSDGSYASDLTFVFQFSTVCLILLLGLDAYWWRKCLPAWRDQAAA